MKDYDLAVFKDWERETVEGMSLNNSEWQQNLLKVVNESVSAIVAEWEEMGINGERLTMRRSYTVQYLSTLLADMLSEEKSSKAVLLELIGKLQAELDQLATELSVPKITLDSNLTMVEREKELYETLNQLNIRRQERLETLERLRTTERSLCERLSETVIELEETGRLVPSEDQINCVTQHINELTNEKRTRLVEFLKLRSNILQLCSTLEILPDGDTPLAGRVLNPQAADTFPMSQAQLAGVRELQTQLSDRVAAMEKECSDLRGRMVTLWDRLEVSEETRRPILVSVVNCTPDVLYQLRCEVERLEAEKKANMPRIIAVCRTELLQWWDRCLVADQDRSYFGQLLNSENDDSKLDKYELEIDNWKCYFTRHQKLFEAIEQWNLLFTQLRDTERKLKDPVVLKNRGGILLKVEKERKRLLNLLPKIETEISGLSAAKMSPPIRLDGQSVSDYIAEAWVTLEEEKENEKKDRQTKAAISKHSPPFGGIQRTPLPRNKLKAEELKFGCKSVQKRQNQLNCSIRTNLHNVSSAKIRRLNEAPAFSSPDPSKFRGVNKHLASAACSTPTTKIFRSPNRLLPKSGKKIKASPISKLPVPNFKLPTNAQMHHMSPLKESSDATVPCQTIQDDKSTYSDFTRGMSDTNPKSTRCCSSTADSGVASGT